MRARLSPALATWLVVSVAAHAGAIVLALGGFRRAPATPSRVQLDRASRVVSGETFEVPLEESPDERDTRAFATESAAAAETRGPRVARRAGAEARAPSRAPATPRAGSAGASRPTGDGPGDGDRPASFGAAGDRSAVDLASAFTRGFPQAASADPLWLTAAFGTAGSVEVTLTIDESGALVDTRSTGAAGDALTAGVRRTLALIRARSFVAEGKETRLRVSATVAADEVHDGLHGEVFAIGGSFDRGAGNGFFALAVGRRVDVRVQVVR
jgi:hypothetical protein